MKIVNRVIITLMVVFDHDAMLDTFIDVFCNFNYVICPHNVNDRSLKILLNCFMCSLDGNI